MKKLGIFAILVIAISILLIPSICFADAAGSYSLSSIYVTMTEPTFNTVVPTDIATNSRNLKITNIVWTDSTGKTLANTDKITNSGSTTVKFDIERSAGDRIAARTYVYINNSTEGVNKSNVSSDKMTVTKTFSVAGGRLSNASGKAQYLSEENYKPVSVIKATISSPKKGEALDQDPKMDETEGALVRGVVWNRYDTTTQKWVEITDKNYKAEEGVKYTASILFNFNVGFKLDPDTKTGWVNTWDVCEVTNLNGNCCITSLTFLIRPTTGSTASRPSTSTTTTTTEATEEPEVTTGKVVTSPELIAALLSGDRLKPITILSGDLVVKPIEKASGELIPDLRPILSPEAAGATNSGDKEEKKEEEKVEEKIETITWAKASSWAIDELDKANKAGLIPTIFDKEDLTKNVTRKEFAHIAVKLYEKISGKKAEAPSKNPFTDTKDEEVLKAYNVGITEGTDKEKGLFSPDKEITREQMATMMARALKEAGVDTKVDLTKVKEFTDDSEMHNWSRDAIYFMSEKGIIKGVSTTENRYGVKGTATREQALLVSVRSVEAFK